MVAAGQDISEMLASYLHVKTIYRVTWDFFDQWNNNHEEIEPGVYDKLERRNQGGDRGGLMMD